MIWEQVISVLWIRTWYGSPSSEVSEAAGTTRATADADYRRLWQKGFMDPDLVSKTLLPSLDLWSSVID
jgi:hypothetical protein